jgi:hypothetical protein
MRMANPIRSRDTDRSPINPSDTKTQPQSPIRQPSLMLEELFECHPKYRTFCGFAKQCSGFQRA